MFLQGQFHSLVVPIAYRMFFPAVMEFCLLQCIYFQFNGNNISKCQDDASSCSDASTCFDDVSVLSANVSACDENNYSHSDSFSTCGGDDSSCGVTFLPTTMAFLRSKGR